MAHLHVPVPQGHPTAPSLAQCRGSIRRHNFLRNQCRGIASRHTCTRPVPLPTTA
ncbi:hypothetical protein PIB30_065757, partial [Stylosanthes scabra]|nr:hypothetical protein [Stylosanthes scabra]